MAKIVVKSKVKKIKRKFPVVLKAPEFLNSAELGNTNITDLNSLIGKTTKINLMYITKNMKNQNVRLVFKIVEVNSGVAMTEVISYSQIPYYLNRFIKVDSTLIEDSIILTSKDGNEIRIKPFMITKSKISKMVGSSIRNKFKEILKKEVESKNAAEFMSSVVFSKVQVMFKNELKKIFPLKVFEFKKVEVLSKK